MPSLAELLVASSNDDAPPSARRVTPEGRPSVRRILEWALHLMALGLVAWVIWQRVRPRSGAGTEVVPQSALRAALGAWSTSDPAPAVHVRFAGVPDPLDRDWLRAIGRAGTRVGWDHVGVAPLPATALDAAPIADPLGGVRAAVAGPVGERVVLVDRLGAIDSAADSHGVVVFRVPGPVAGVRARVDGATAIAGPIDSLVVRRVLVLARAGWEGKFVARALQDEGWPVDVHFIVAPKNDVISPDVLAIDTAHYAAVVAIDSGIVGQAPGLIAYVRSGGGLVVGAHDVGAIGSIAPGATLAVIRGLPTLADSAPRRGLTLAPVRPAAEAVALERRDTLVAVAARRLGNGRVAVVGYTDTWRWRMALGDSGVAAHRTWWAHVVAAVAYAPAARRALAARVDGIPPADPAPLAATVAQLGSEHAAPGRVGATGREPLSVWAFAVIVLAVITEWASRRLRGRR
jgi:hypothetical protein